MIKRPAMEGGKPARKKFLVFGSPLIEDNEIKEVIDTLHSGWIGKGPKVKKLEEMFRRYKGTKYAIALNSCTAALHLSLLAIGVKPEDEVITTPMTFCATINTIIHSGAVPVLADCEKETMNISPTEIKRKINSKTVAILPVHFAGRPCKMDEIMDIAKKHHLKAIEDCAHAIEAEYQGTKTGTFADTGCFSFYVTKNITTAEGGMVTTNNNKYAEKITVLGLHGMTKDAWNRFGDVGYKHYQVIAPGFKYNMTDIQAAIGIHQLPRIDRYWQRRQEIWNRYNNAFRNLPCFIPSPIEKDVRHAYHLYTLLLDIDNLSVNRDFILSALTKENIGVGVHYLAIHSHPYYSRSFGYRWGDFPNAEFISDRTISLPLSAKLSDEDVNDVIKAVKKLLVYYYKKQKF